MPPHQHLHLQPDLKPFTLRAPQACRSDSQGFDKLCRNRPFRTEGLT